MGELFMHNSRRWVLTLLLLASLPALAGCRAERPADRFTLQDDAGDSVAVAIPARRVVSLIPATTELLFALGAGDRVVGRTGWDSVPAAALAVTNVGDGIRPNIEAVVAQHPDLVVLYHSAQNAEAAARLRGLGIPAIRLATDGLDDLARQAALLGRLLGRPATGDSLGRWLRAELSAATAPDSGRGPRVLILVWDQPPMTVGRGSFLHDVVERAGGRNVFGDLVTSSAPISVEAVVARDPDYILSLGRDVPSVADRPEWQAVRAVRERRFLGMEGSALSWPSPRTPAAIRLLASMLHPDTVAP